MGDGIRFFSKSDVEHALCDTGACDGGAQKVAALIDRISLKHREDIIPGKGLTEIAYEAFAGTRIEGFFLEAIQLITLSHVCAVGNDVRAVSLFEPGKQDGGVQPSGVSDDDFHRRAT